MFIVIPLLLLLLRRRRESANRQLALAVRDKQACDEMRATHPLKPNDCAKLQANTTTATNNNCSDYQIDM
jgi:hypothetical protein